MTEDRVYFNSELFKNSFDEKEKEILNNISTLKYEVKKISYKAYNMKYDYRSLIEEKKIKSIEIQEEYEKLSAKLFYQELKKALLNSKKISNLKSKLILIKILMKNLEVELKNIKLQIKEKNKLIAKLQK